MLGIIIGVGAVIAMVAVGAGAQARVAEQIQSLGSNLIIVLLGKRRPGGVRDRLRQPAHHHRGGRRAIEREMPLVQAAAPSVRGRGAGRLRQSQLVAPRSRAITPEYFEAREWRVDRTAASSPRRTWTVRAKVALLGQTRAPEPLRRRRSRWARSSASRRSRSRSSACSSRKGQNTWGQDQDDVILIPMSTAKKKVLGRQPGQRPRSVGSISVRVRDAAMNGRRPRTQIRQLLRQRHRLQPYQDDDFWIRNLSEVLQTQEAASQVMTYAPGRHRLRLAARGRHRHHEHHAGLGDGADTRDRPAHGRRRPRARHPARSSRGGGDALADRRRHRDRCSASSAPGPSAYFAEWRTLVSSQSDPDRLRLRGRRRDLLRLLSRPEGGRGSTPSKP